MNGYFSYKQAMQYLGFDSYKSLTRLIENGLPTIQVGKTKRISKHDIDIFMKKHTVIQHLEGGGINGISKNTTTH